MSPTKIAWISFFPIEWMPDLPESLRGLPKQHPASWQRVLLEELKPLKDLKLDVLVVRSSFPHSFTFSREDINFHCLKLPGGTRGLSLFWWETFLIRKRLQEIQPDLVHAWGSERGAALVASRLSYPYLVTMQGLLQWYSEQVKLNIHHRLEARLEHVALKRASIITAESRFAVKWLQDKYPHLEVHQAEHAPDWIFHRVERRPETKPPRFLFIGAMGMIKGTDLLLRALDRLSKERDFRLTIVGSAASDFLQKMKGQTSPGLWERITILHDLTPLQVAQEMARATLLLFPTRADTSPNSVKEAVVAGLPVVASAIGGIVDYVFPGENGFTCQPGDLNGFVNTIHEALAHPLFSQGKVEAQTLERVRAYLSPQQMRERFTAAYQRVLERGRA